MAYRELPFVGVVTADSIAKENFIIATGNFASASNQISDFTVSTGDVNLLRVGQTIYSVGGVVPTNAVITNINGSLITMDSTASADAASDTIGISTPSGSYLFQSASFTDPRGELTVGDITGSDDDPTKRFAILGVAKRGGSTRPGAFHLYNVSEVVYDNASSAELSFFIEWGEAGEEADSGDILQDAERTVLILDKTASGSLAAGMSREITGLENIVAGSEVAGYNLAITQYLSDLSGSSGGGTTATGSFTGSFTGSVLGDLLGTASIADFATTASHIVTASFADGATTASIADELSGLATASFADRATSASIANTATTASHVVTSSFADTSTSASIADTATTASHVVTASFAISASYAVSASHEIVYEESSSFAETASLANRLAIEATASIADTATSASIADELSQLATASQADDATTASFAETGDGIFSGSFSGSFQGDGTNLTGVASPTGSYTGSFTGSFLGDIIGTASIADTATSASIADTASFFDGTVTSASHAETASIRYDSGSSTITGLNEIKINDFDTNVGVTFQDSKLTLTFGSPTTPSISSFFNSGFNTNRFNKVEDTYTVTANWNNGGYTFVSASIYTGSTELTHSLDAGDTNLTISLTTSGSQRYFLYYTASSPLDNTEYYLSQTVTSTLSKTNPTNPSISSTPTVQLGASSNQIEQGATGSIVFSSAYGSSNGWDQVSLVNTPANSPLEVTGSATGSNSLSIQAVASYESPDGDNDPQRTTSRTSTRTFSKIRSVRYGAATASAFTQAEYEDLGAWDTTLGGDIGTIDKGNTSPVGDDIVITWSGDKYHYIVYNSSLGDLSGISTSGFSVIGQFTRTTVGNYKVYRTNDLQAGGASTSITYSLS